MTTIEMAGLLSISENTVKTRLRRAREMLKARVETLGWEELLNE
ncbi:MAG: sigma factor-like helix-turn-helix DNA-binding protein [Solibacillus sp.]